MKLILRVLSGKKYGQRIVVGRGQSSTVGRSNAAQYSFDDDHMSSLHFEVENFGSYAEVRDLRSTNRTWLNNNYVASAPLKHGDRLRAGKTVLAVEIEHTAVVDDAGPTPKPTILESTNQVAMPQSKAELQALVSPEAAVAPAMAEAAPPGPNEALQPPPHEPLQVAAKLGPMDEVAPVPEAARSERPVMVVATPIHRAESVVPPPHQFPAQPLHGSPVPVTTARSEQHDHHYRAAPVTPLPVPPPPPPPDEAQVEARQEIRPLAAVGSAPLTSAPEVRRATVSPIESVEFSPPLPREHGRDPNGRDHNRPMPSSRERSGSNPIESSSLYIGRPIDAPGDKRRFRHYERIGDFQYLHNLRNVISALSARRAVRVVAHFSKIRMIAPQLSEVAPLYPDFPGATTHWPVSLTYRDWESPTVQTVAARLCSNDALLVLVGEYNSDLVAAAQAVGAEGIKGFCEPGGYLGWSSPSAFAAFAQLLGTKCWGDVLGPTIEGAIMCNPMHQEVLWAFAAECLESELKLLGFTTVV